MIFIDDGMLSWYYSILETLDEYQEGTGGSLSADVAELVAITTAVRHAITGNTRWHRDSLVIDRAWESYDLQVDRSIGMTSPLYGSPALRPYLRPAHSISRWTADAMKYAMQATGFDERKTRRMMHRHHLNQTRRPKSWTPE